jgi:mono/diheme cytochrome c family protein
MGIRQRTKVVAVAMAVALTVPLGAAHGGGETLPNQVLIKEVRHAARLIITPAGLRGALVFNAYCTTCHGYNADGNGRAARLYSPPPANLLLTSLTQEQLAAIISKGGEMVGRAPFMPPWEDELTREQIADVVEYISIINKAYLAALRAKREAKD